MVIYGEKILNSFISEIHIYRGDPFSRRYRVIAFISLLTPTVNPCFETSIISTFSEHFTQTPDIKALLLLGKHVLSASSTCEELSTLNVYPFIMIRRVKSAKKFSTTFSKSRDH